MDGLYTQLVKRTRATPPPEMENDAQLYVNQFASDLHEVNPAR